jgi:hypothetical protein
MKQPFIFSNTVTGKGDYIDCFVCCNSGGLYHFHAEPYSARLTCPRCGASDSGTIGASISNFMKYLADLRLHREHMLNG